MIPAENKYKIYISALTQLNVDDHNRIPADARLIRRMVGSSVQRNTGCGNPADVVFCQKRRGKEHIPLSGISGYIRSTAHELAVLKPFILPLGRGARTPSEVNG